MGGRELAGGQYPPQSAVPAAGAGPDLV